MDIRTFFNAEYSRLQTTNKNIESELEKTLKLVESQTKDFERVNTILRGLLQDKTKSAKKTNDIKENNKNRNIQTRLAKSIKAIFQKPDSKKIVKETKSVSESLKITSSKMLIPHLTIQNASFKNVNFSQFQKQKVSQSSEDFYRTDDVSSNYEEKLKILRRIDKTLSNKPSFDMKEDGEKSEGGGFFGNIKGIIGTLLGGGLFAGIMKKLLPFGLGKAGRLGRIGQVLTGKAAQKLGTVGKAAGKLGGKALPIVGAVFSIYDMVKAIKTGFSDYKKYKSEGDSLAAEGAISSTLMNVFGNTINVVGSFLPGPLGIALFALGTSMTMVSDSMREAKGKTSGYVGEAREKVAKTEQLIESEKSKGTMVQLRPNFKDYKNIYWEFNNGEDWVPVIDASTGKYLSAMSGKNPIITSTDPKKPGIQTYKLNTKSGIREIVAEGGNIYMIVPNVGKVAISTRKNGGSVVRNKTYVVGEHQAETYVPNSKKNKKREIEVQTYKTELRKQQLKQQAEIDRRFKSFLDDMKEITTVFSSTPTGIPRTSSIKDNVITTASIIDKTKEYPTMKVETVGKDTTIGARYSAVKNHLQEASIKTGIPLETLVKFAHVESSMISDVAAKTSTATGLFQFTKGTWKDQLKKYGAKFGLTETAERTDPKANSLMGAMYIKENMDTLKRRGLEINEQNLYLLHFLGPGGGPKLIKTAQSAPDTIAANILPDAASRNPKVFYSNGVAKSVDEIYKWAQKKMSVDISYMNSFDIGSWNIDKDQEAFVHKGEIIIPEYYANKIRAEARSGNLKTTTPTIIEEYDIYSDSNFWINTFMPALANVVKMEYGGKQ